MAKEIMDEEPAIAEPERLEIVRQSAYQLAALIGNLREASFKHDQCSLDLVSLAQGLTPRLLELSYAIVGAVDDTTQSMRELACCVHGPAA